MYEVTQPMTKLEGINICLSSMGEPAINALDDAGVDAQMAADLIDETSRGVQLKGWHWNRETHKLQPDQQGNLNLPMNTAKVDSTSVDIAVDVVQRGLRLFDRVNNTYTFTKPVTLELYVILPYDELPQSAKNFIAYEAACRFQRRLLGSDSIDKFLVEARNEARVELIRDDIQVSDPNMLKDNWTTASIMQRGAFRRGGY